ncbi:MAG: ACP S-malonyltransferase, partial [Deltaproteobacteria bacterium]
MGKTAYVFPGQGSQYPGMGKELTENFRIAREVFEEADDALGWKVSKLCYEGPDEELKLTSNTQPAILATSYAVLKVLASETGIRPDYLAGHSLGEYSALVAAGVFGFADMLRTVRMRGT